MKPLMGNSDVLIDDKSRMLIPSVIRKAMQPEDGEAFVLKHGNNGKPWLYTERQYEELAGRLASELAPGADRHKFDEYHFAMTYRVEPDKQSRILIPEKLIRKSGLGREVTVIGMRDHAEIWNRAEWLAREDELVGDVPSAAANAGPPAAKPEHLS